MGIYICATYDGAVEATEVVLGCTLAGVVSVITFANWFDCVVVVTVVVAGVDTEVLTVEDVEDDGLLTALVTGVLTVWAVVIAVVMVGLLGYTGGAVVVTFDELIDATKGTPPKHITSCKSFGTLKYMCTFKTSTFLCSSNIKRNV